MQSIRTTASNLSFSVCIGELFPVLSSVAAILNFWWPIWIGDVANSRRPQRLRVDFQLRVRTNAKTWVRVKMKVHAKVRGLKIHRNRPTFPGLVWPFRPVLWNCVWFYFAVGKLNFFISFLTQNLQSQFFRNTSLRIFYFLSRSKQVLGALWMWEVIHIRIFYSKLIFWHIVIGESSIFHLYHVYGVQKSPCMDFTQLNMGHFCSNFKELYWVARPVDDLTCHW